MANEIFMENQEYLCTVVNRSLQGDRLRRIKKSAVDVEIRCDAVSRSQSLFLNIFFSNGKIDMTVHVALFNGKKSEDSHGDNSMISIHSKKTLYRVNIVSVSTAI